MKTIKMIALLFLLLPLAAQNAATFSEPSGPFIPQSFAFDKKHDFFAVINQADNEIVMVSRKGDGKPEISHRFSVDKVKERRDGQRIYRPTSVAIYDGYVAFLASHQDSCYFAVLNLNGKLETKLTFPGYANAFSYHQPANELYITGENETGFNVIVLNTRNGVNRVDSKDASMLHYENPRLPEEIAGRDTWTICLMVTVICVVLLVLLVFYLFFKRAGVRLITTQELLIHKPKNEDVEPKQETVASNVAVSDGVYAAIATAIYLYGEELHDVENTVLTINKVSRTYSPWSSKIHGLNTYFKR